MGRPHAVLFIPAHITDIIASAVFETLGLFPSGSGIGPVFLFREAVAGSLLADSDIRIDKRSPLITGIA